MPQSSIARAGHYPPRGKHEARQVTIKDRKLLNPGNWPDEP